MPKVISDVPELVLSRIYELVDKAQYSSVDSFVRISIENQLALEGGNSQPPLPGAGRLAASSGKLKSYSFPYDRTLQVLEPASFDDLNVADVENERDLWLWGQVNRILPLKFALRLLARYQLPDCNAINYTQFIRDLMPEAREMGAQLELQDRSLGKERGEGLSVAFPTGRDVQKAEERYRNLFIGSCRGDGKQLGALPMLKFVTLLREGDSISIGLTKAGLKFAELDNPPIDSANFDKSLGEKEINFFLAHILQNVPGEVQAYKLILSSMSSGKTRREEINETISSMYPSWTQPMVNTQRTGAMSRMFELGLFEKRKIGVTVLYTLAERGSEFLERGSEPGKEAIV